MEFSIDQVNSLGTFFVNSKFVNSLKLENYIIVIYIQTHIYLQILLLKLWERIGYSNKIILSKLGV